MVNIRRSVRDHFCNLHKCRPHLYIELTIKGHSPVVIKDKSPLFPCLSWELWGRPILITNLSNYSRTTHYASSKAHTVCSSVPTNTGTPSQTSALKVLFPFLYLLLNSSFHRSTNFPFLSAFIFPFTHFPDFTSHKSRTHISQVKSCVDELSLWRRGRRLWAPAIFKVVNNWCSIETYESE